MDINGFIENCLENIKIIKKRDETPKTFFVITSTVKQSYNKESYVTPARFFKYFHLTGCVVFSQKDARVIAQKVDGLVDYILVDVEKKIPLGDETDSNGDIDGMSGKTIGNLASGNVSSEVFESVKKSKLHYFKGNDITVESVWLFLESKLNDFSGVKVAIIGSGNIGSKLALKLVESGCHVCIYRRDVFKGNIISQAMNLIKPEATISNIEYVDSIIKACFLADIVIGCTNGIEAIDVKHIKGSKRDVICIDVGKGAFSRNVADYLAGKGVLMYRTDITASLEGYITSVLRNCEILSASCGRKEYDGVTVVSGGILGAEGELVVDNFSNPCCVIGVADGKGDFKKIMSVEDKNKLAKLSKIIARERGL